MIPITMPLTEKGRIGSKIMFPCKRTREKWPVGALGSTIKCLERKNGEHRPVGAVGSKIKCPAKTNLRE